MNDVKNPYAGYRYPAEIISHAVWLYFRFTLSYRDVEELLGSVDISSSPNEESDEVQEGHEVVSGFLETRGDTAIMLDLVEKAFDEMAFLVKMPVVDPLVEAVGTRRDDGLHAAFLHDRHERIGIVALIGDHGVGWEFPDQPFGLPDIGRLPPVRMKVKGLPKASVTA